MTTIDLEDAESFIDDLGEKIHQAALRGLHSAAMRGVQVITTRIVPSRSPQPVDRGLYRAGWKAIPERDGATIENNEPHAVLIENGVRAANIKIGARMIVALTEWVSRKGLASGKEAIAAAWAIAKAMQKRGIFRRGQGFGILEELIDKHIEDIIRTEIGHEIDRAL